MPATEVIVQPPGTDGIQLAIDTAIGLVPACEFAEITCQTGS